MRRFLKSLFGQVVIALLLGIIVGVSWPGFASQMKPLGDGFIKLIRMIIALLVFGVVVDGIVGAGDLKKVGRVGLKAVVYFEAVTTVALFLGIVMAYVFQPGVGMNINAATLDGTALNSYTAHTSQVTSIVGFLMRIIPTTVFDAFTKGDVLQVLVIAILFGAGLSVAGEPARPVATIIAQATDVLFKVVGFIVKLAPIGVFGAIAYTIGNYGLASLEQLGYLVLLFYVSVAVFIFGVLGLILRLAGFSIFKLVAYLREEITIVAGTASSDSVLPQVMRKLEHLGVKDSTVGLVIPTGYSFNLDAFSIYLTLAAVFIAQATNTPLSTEHLLLILGVALLASKGAHGVPGSAIVVLAATLSAIPVIPAVGLVLVLSVDWFMGMARALGNLFGNSVATIVVAAWEGDIDRARARQVLNGKISLQDGDDALIPAFSPAGASDLQASVSL